MTIRTASEIPPWLLLVFTLPAKRASQRVEVWRKLQRYGVVALGNSGYLLPNTPGNQERFEWLASAVRDYGGNASVVDVQAIDNLSKSQLIRRFADERAREYREIIKDLAKLASRLQHKRFGKQLNRLRGRFQEVASVDFFQSPLRAHVEKLIERAEKNASHIPSAPARSKLRVRDYQGKTWVTRHRPGIDRCASAWLVRRFIDPRARFDFAEEGRVPPQAVSFDMYHGGFGHRGDDCTFETLENEFRIRNLKANIIGQIVHDADLFDQKFGRNEGFGIDEVLKGWARRGMSDHDLLNRGMDLIEALHSSVP
jgi:hypothetical protein